jgi:RNA polymerase sigma-70 factor, ECF subfamily
VGGVRDGGIDGGVDGGEAVLMTISSSANRLISFESCRRDLVTLAYRMLGDMGRAEDMVQEAWLRWSGQAVDVDSPKAYLVTVVTRLCLNELGSARARREEIRPDRLPEPVALDDAGPSRIEEIDQVSMALLVILQRLKPAERAVLLLHDVFDVPHDEIAPLLGKSPPACRKLLERARQSVADERRVMSASSEEHGRLLRTFLAAAAAGDVKALVGLLAEDAVMISDGGPNGVSAGGFRNLPRPLHGATRIAEFVAAATARNGGGLRVEERQLNGRPAIVFWRGDGPFAALLVAAAGGKIHRIFFHADTTRLRYVGRCA